MIIFGEKNTANCYGELGGTPISAQTAVWFGKLELPRQTRYCMVPTTEGTVERLVCSDFLCDNGIHANPQHRF